MAELTAGSHLRNDQLGRRGLALALVALASLQAPAIAADVAVRKLRENSYELTLSNDAVLEEQVAHAYMSQAAASLCSFVQEVTCVPRPQSVALPRPPVATTPEELERVRGEIKKLSESYFRLLAAGKFGDAYARMQAWSAREGDGMWNVTCRGKSCLCTGVRAHNESHSFHCARAAQ